LSVYTPVSEPELAAWLGSYSVGSLLACEPIKAGIENTNYFVDTSQGRYVLTLFERLPADELPFYLELMAHLARHGIPCPAPIADVTDSYLRRLNGKPAALVTRLAGRCRAPGRRGVRRARRAARAHARRGAFLRRVSREPARSALVALRGARGCALPGCRQELAAGR
jgi:Ser/Thr protein kinase RdoA (MazF antagonist)